MIQMMVFQQAAAEIVLFDNSDVIRTSGGDIENSGGGCPGNSPNRGSGGNHGQCSGNSGSRGQGKH